MKLSWIVLALAVVTLCANFAMAGGDQNQNNHRGDKGKGQVNQHQVNN